MLIGLTTAATGVFLVCAAAAIATPAEGTTGVLALPFEALFRAADTLATELLLLVVCWLHVDVELFAIARGGL